ncbi:MAG TPA: hypothetical protein VGM37_16155 [Armatimonadota bacterium]|jgi:hypothetical protein
MDTEQQLLVAIRAHAMRHGSCPSVWEIAFTTGQTEHAILGVAQELARRRLVKECPGLDAPLQLTVDGFAEARRIQEGAWMPPPRLADNGRSRAIR